ncbi:hypothetical protein [Paenibacillus sp. MSJ-34]|uniref:hypothetical protein n=1 Tax=Paenibacillus sp. MSJ-34 TaxID=2841529 RepID=UPI001C1024B1|nr:hypothetical protein [Paenibacillus sp. MSJ-34]MBU5445578.1 hypothetical protein [Paenibacillus sp. MSJ-34]
MIEAAKFLIESKSWLIASIFIFLAMIPSAIRAFSKTKLELMLLSRDKRRWNILLKYIFGGIGLTAFNIVIGFLFWEGIEKKNIDIVIKLAAIIIVLYFFVFLFLLILLFFKKIKKINYSKNMKNIILLIIMLHMIMLWFMYFAIDISFFYHVLEMTTLKGNEIPIILFVFLSLIPGIIVEGYLNWARSYGFPQPKQKIITIETEQGELYLLNTKDEKTLILGDKEYEEDCDRIFYYNIEEGKVTTTLKIGHIS